MKSCWSITSKKKSPAGQLVQRGALPCVACRASSHGFSFKVKRVSVLPMFSMDVFPSGEPHERNSKMRSIILPNETHTCL
jgi:hypothetical protein